MRVVIGGASGFIGSNLAEALRRRGDEVVELVRRPATSPEESSWDPAAGRVDRSVLEGSDVVVNLGGVGIGDRRLTEERKRAILNSRLEATGTLAAAVADLDDPPGSFISASAIGVYGDRGDEVLTEASPFGPDDDFLVSVVAQWEAAAQPAAAASEVAWLRSGLVMGDGGILERLLLPFKLGVGGRMGSGDQWWSWISLEDEIRAILHIIDHRLRGPYNLTAPNPVTNAEFAAVLGKVLRRPTILPTPKFALDIVLGAERAEALVFTSAHVLPTALQHSGFVFVHPDLREALRSELSK